MGKTFVIHSQEEWCAMLCDNYIPEEEQEDEETVESVDIPPEE